MTDTFSTSNQDGALDFDHSLVEYIRDNNNQRIGMLMAVMENGTNLIRIGWSLTREGSDDKFSVDRAYVITLGRVELAEVHKVTIPFSIAESVNGKAPILENFVLRCMKYYKSNNVTVFGRIRKDLIVAGQLAYAEYSLM